MTGVQVPVQRAGAFRVDGEQLAGPQDPCGDFECDQGAACIAAIAMPMTGSRAAASQPVCSAGRLAIWRRSASMNKASAILDSRMERPG